MTLPKIAAHTEMVDVEGEIFGIRVFTRAEAARFHKMQEDDVSKAELEIAVIAAATDTPLEDTRDWYGKTPTYAVEELIGHIQRVSRLTGEAQKSG